MSPAHPLDPLTADEINAVSLATRKYAAETQQIRAVKHLTIALVPPPKRVVLAALGIPLQTGDAPLPKPLEEELRRKAESLYLDVAGGGRMYEAQLELKGGEWAVGAVKQLEEGLQGQITPDELDKADEVIRADPRVIELAAEVGIKPEQLYADGWAIGYDDRFDKSLRLQQCLLYARLGKHDHLYAHPLDFMPVLDSNAEKVVHIDFASHCQGGAPRTSTVPPALDQASLDRARILPPLEPIEYLPDLMPKGYKFRDTVKPLHVTQPDGVSFSVEGNRVRWEKWDFHVGFHHREGLVLSTVTYDDTDQGLLRPLFYRVSNAEMVVPYGETAWPHARKHAMDTGEYGMGTLANDLKLGCDCLGTIKYLPGAFVGNDGAAKVIENAICIHEEDAGLLFKHTDYRSGGRSHAVRSRKLVVQMINTVANYGLYIFAWCFYQDGSIELEVRLTGILNTYVLGEDEDPSPHGTQVAPRVSAQYHQHIFSLRVDPMIDGINNSVVETDIAPIPYPTGSAENFAGNGFSATRTILESTSVGGRPSDASKERSWSIAGNRKHYASGLPGSYKIMAGGALVPFQLQPNSWVARRAPYATKSMWVTPFEEDQLYPAGKYLPQTREALKDSVSYWMEGDKNIKDTDVVCYLTYGVTHIPRPEDFPIMPAEHVRIFLKPTSFFRVNPALDLPASKDTKSVLALGTGASTAKAGKPEGGLKEVEGKKGSCCVA